MDETMRRQTGVVKSHSGVLRPDLSLHLGIMRVMAVTFAAAAGHPAAVGVCRFTRLDGLPTGLARVRLAAGPAALAVGDVGFVTVLRHG
jgi:hypothetical protein